MNPPPPLAMVLKFASDLFLFICLLDDTNYENWQKVLVLFISVTANCNAVVGLEFITTFASAVDKLNGLWNWILWLALR